MKRALSLVTATLLASAFALGACSGKEIDAGQDNGLSKGDGGGDSGACCPTGYDLYACTFASGGSGYACHNPAMGCASSTTCGEGCDPVVTGACGADGGPPTQLQWYSTCGYPVCFVGDGGGPADAGVCPKEGTPCTEKGATCGVPDDQNCGVTFVCDDHDPKGMSCPISTKKYKDDINYVDEAQLQALHDETLKMKLATYNYKSAVADPDPKHLGFIIEDQPAQSLAVDANRNRVDMYGYFSMIVATQQVQEKEIAQLRAELKDSEARAAACNAAKK